MASGPRSTVQTSLAFAVDNPASRAGRNSGPPNRMNDLSYREWMKFQKSFFRHETDQEMVEEFIAFFTKATWPNGCAARILVVGFESFVVPADVAPRVVTHVPTPLEGEFLTEGPPMEGRYDFIAIDLRTLDESRMRALVGQEGTQLARRLRQWLYDDRYCCLVVRLPSPGGGGYPIPWALATTMRGELRLRDEKVALVEAEQRVEYCLFFQSADDARSNADCALHGMQLARSGCADVPAWLIPRSPPRSQKEILHPAKFPEQLIEEFVRCSSESDDNVLDPMVGTGSAVIAALRCGRNGYGVDLSPEFVEIARGRIAEAQEPTLFDESRNVGEVYVGDASRLDEVAEFEDVVFQYAVTSPPYWSMLQNPGSENQRSRRNKRLPLVYSEDKRDLGNIVDYDRFLGRLVDIYRDVAKRLGDGGRLTVIVKNVKRHQVLYTLAWDLAFELSGPSGPYAFCGATLWCQDDIGLKPFAVGIHWVSNILHTYCLHFEKVAD